MRIGMAYTVMPRTSITGVHNLHGLNSISFQADLSYGTRHLLSTRVLIPLSSGVMSNCRSQSHPKWVGSYDSGSIASSLTYRGKLTSVCPDGVSKDSKKGLSLNRYKMSIQKKFNGQSRLGNYSYSSKFYSDGPFVENDEKTNNEILQSYCNRGKLLDAVKLVDVMTRRNQIPDFPSCIKLIRGLINVEKTEKAAKVLGLMVMSGGVPDIITHNLLIGNLCRKGQFNAAIDVMEDMSLSGCPPYIFSFNTII